MRRKWKREFCGENTLCKISENGYGIIVLGHNPCWQFSIWSRRLKYRRGGYRSAESAKRAALRESKRMREEVYS